MSETEELKVGLVVAGEDLSGLEALPIDSLWAGGHVAAPNPTPEAMMGLARLSAATNRVMIGTSILLLPLYQPAIIAKQIADLDRYTDGRVVLGVGVGGEYPAEFSACGVPIAERGRRTDEMIPLMRRLWTGEVVSHDGPHYPMTDVRIHPPPVQDGGPSIIVAGRKAPAMRRAALMGDGWMPYLYSPERYAASVKEIREVAHQVNRDLSTFAWYAFIFVNLDHDGERARDDAVATLGGAYRQDFRSYVDRVAAVGTPTEVRTALQGFVDAGARHLIFVPAGRPAHARAMFEALLADVVPTLDVGSQPAQVKRSNA